MKFLASGNQTREQTQSNEPVLLAQHHRPPEGVVRSLDSRVKTEMGPFCNSNFGYLESIPDLQGACA